MEVEAYRPGRKSAWWLLVAGWIVSPLGPLSFALPFLLLLAMWRAVCARAPVVLGIICLLNPLSIFFARGVVDYCGGRPAFRGMGLPSYEAGNVDPETRCFHRSGGCVVSGEEWVHIAPHNLALHLLVLVLGPPSGTYDGPYPTREEAIAASTSGTPVSRADFRSGKIQTQTKPVVLKQEMTTAIAEKLLGLSRYAFDDIEDGFKDQLFATIWRERCLILRWRDDPEQSNGSEIAELIILVDIHDSRPFAIHRISGSPLLQRNAIAWFWK